MTEEVVGRVTSGRVTVEVVPSGESDVPHKGTDARDDVARPQVGSTGDETARQDG